MDRINLKSNVKKFSTEIEELDKLNNYIGKSMLLILGNCSAIFDGRIKSTLTDADRILIIKKDLTILLHADKGVKPVQWQLPNKGKIKFIVEDDFLMMETYRPKTDENFIINFNSIYSVQVYETFDYSESSIIGDEKDLNLYLFQNPEKIESGLKMIDREKETDVGFVDLLAEDEKDNLVVIELKKQVATLADTQQLKRYLDFFKINSNRPVRAILVAPSFPQRVEKLLLKNDMSYSIIKWREMFPVVKRTQHIKKTKKLDSFFQK